MHPLASLLLLLAAPPVDVVSVVVGEPVHDALYAGGEVRLLSGSALGAGRHVFSVDAAGRLSPLPPPPEGAVAADACPLPGGKEGLVYADARGIVDERGRRLLEADALFGVPDPRTLYVTPLCGGPGRGELRLPSRDGLVVQGPKGPAVTLAFPPAARAYSGQVHRGLGAARAYALAVSLYAPRLYDADVDGDGRLDLIALHEGRLSWFRRGAAGSLDRAPALSLALHDKLGISPAADLRVVPGDADGDGRAELYVGVSEGPVPERSAVYRLGGTGGSLDAAPVRLLERAALLAPLGVVSRKAGRALLLFEVDTSLVTLGAVLVTGQVGLKLGLADRGRPPLRPSLELVAHADVRQGRMAGALPVVTVDFDGDGRSDLLDLGVPGRAVLHRGLDDGLVQDLYEGFAEAPSAILEVPAFVHVVPLPALPGVLLIGAPEPEGKTVLALLRGVTARRRR